MIKYLNSSCLSIVVLLLYSMSANYSRAVVGVAQFWAKGCLESQVGIAFWKSSWNWLACLFGLWCVFLFSRRQPLPKILSQLYIHTEDVYNMVYTCIWNTNILNMLHIFWHKTFQRARIHHGSCMGW